MGEYVRLDVVYANEWDIKGLGDGLRRAMAHE
jgi:hypothetical protein